MLGTGFDGVTVVLGIIIIIIKIVVMFNEKIGND